MLNDTHEDYDLEEQRTKTKIVFEMAQLLTHVQKDDSDPEEWWSIMKWAIYQIKKYKIDHSTSPGPTRRAFYTIATLSMKMNGISSLDKFRRESEAIVSDWVKSNEQLENVDIVQTMTFFVCVFSMWSAYDQLMVITRNEKYKGIANLLVDKFKSSTIACDHDLNGKKD